MTRQTSVIPWLWLKIRPRPMPPASSCATLGHLMRPRFLRNSASAFATDERRGMADYRVYRLGFRAEYGFDSTLWPGHGMVARAARLAGQIVRRNLHLAPAGHASGGDRVDPA